MLTKEEGIEIEIIFQTLLEMINLVEESIFYNNEDLNDSIKKDFLSWYEDYRKNKTLINIRTDVLENLNLEITDVFSKYIEKESPTENYIEVLLFYFGKLEKYWKLEFERNSKGVDVSAV